MKKTHLILTINLISIWLCSTTQLQAELFDVYFGSNGKTSDGIYHGKFNDKNGKITNAKQTVDIYSPAFLAKNPIRPIIYAVAGKKETVVAAYAIADDGQLNAINQVPSGDGNSAHISVHPTGQFLITAQYRAGSVLVYPIDEKGAVKEHSQLIKHTGGSKIIPRRQESPHPHWSGFSPDGKFAFIPDLGCDQIVIYKVDLKSKKLLAHGNAKVAPGSAPRHMRFSVDGRFIFLLNEISLTVSTFAYNASNGSTKLLKTVQTLSDEIKKKEASNAASEILVHSNGKFIYTANRGNDSVTTYHLESKSGTLTPGEVEPIRGSWPRSINLDPTAKWLLAAGQFSNTISVFSIDEKTGELTFSNKNIINIPSPSCILFSKKNH